MRWNFAAIIFISVPPTFAASPVDFSREILPILSDACFHCHGPDEKGRKAKLRLDTQDGLYRTLDGITIVTPGNPDKSELLIRLLSHDEEEIMPPPKANRKITEKEITTLRQWIIEGAPYGKHWAYNSVKVQIPPSVQHTTWPKNSIDNFVLATLESERLQPTSESDKERLIRRVSLDLTGLPPTPAESDAFLADPNANAYEKLVDSLLASTRFGERVATDWLDLARFADSHGYQVDRNRPVWAYRDWVINAFNRNMPFDEFVISQLAGDLLENPTKDQRIATAFNRLHCQNEEGGIVEEEFRVAYVTDRVNTFGTAFLGATFECARCHDHKYDPISMRDTYSLFAFFQNIDEAGQISTFTENMPVPTLLLSNDEQDQTLNSLQQRITAAEQELAKCRTESVNDFEQWLNTRAALPELTGLIADYNFESLKDGKIENRLDPEKPGKRVDEVHLVPGRDGQVAAFNGEDGFTFSNVGIFSRADSFSIGVWIRAEQLAPRTVLVHRSKAPVDAGSRGYELLLEDGHVAVGIHHMWPENSLKVHTKQTVKANEWFHLAFTYDGSSKAAGVTVYINGNRCEQEVVRDGLWKDITYPGADIPLAVAHRFRDSGFKDGQMDDLRIFNRELCALEINHLAGGKSLESAWSAVTPTAGERDQLFDYYLNNISDSFRKYRSALQKVRDEQRNFIEPIAEIVTMKELPQPKKAFILKRGDYDQPGEEVAANTPAFLPPLAPNAPRNRLGLAQWLTAPENPLMSRVTVNRAWQMMFGRGIVETSDNFGTQGALPTHPELLDWLAMEFMRSGWNYKALLKTIAMSATYRQSSQATPELLARDPQNLLLARGPMRRLSAEMLRDQALASSGLLVEKIGGPSVLPYQPPGLWEAIAMGKQSYQQGHGDDLHRRTLYTFWKRTVPHPVLVTFDAADRSYCTVHRQTTSTPLQALTLLNDVQIVEAARFIGQRMLKEGGTDLQAQLAFGFRLTTNRNASAKELVVISKMFTEQLEEFSAAPENANKLLTFGESKNDPALPAPQLAAATSVALALLNHDEAVFSR